MIDKRFQGLGYFNRLWMQSLTLLEQSQLEEQQVFGYLMNRKIIARSCYLHYGFKETGEVIEDEIVAIYDLTTRIKRQTWISMINYKL